jgi:MoaA/NifB/PqqE/SkfB family radical SAM enzyme
MIVVCRVTTHCNLACGFCAYDRRLPFPRTQIDEAAVARLVDLLGDYRERSGESVLLSWLGGEPLLWRPWVKWSARARERGLRVSATTNGSTLHLEGVREAIVEHLDELTVSIDAHGAVHDALRRSPGLQARAMHGLEELGRQARQQQQQRSRASPLPQHQHHHQPQQLRLRANIVLMRQTLAGFAPLARELAAIGVDEISFNLLGGRDRPEFHAREAASTEALNGFLDALPALRSELSASGTTVLGDAGYARRLSAALRGATWPMPDCAPGERFLFVDEHARIAPCAFTGAELGIPVLTVERIESLGAHFRGEHARVGPAVCNDCPSTQVSGKFARPGPGVDFAVQLESA